MKVKKADDYQSWFIEEGDEDLLIDPWFDYALVDGKGWFLQRKKEKKSYLTEDENCDFEFGPLQKISKEGRLKAFKHEGFWQCMDNIRERNYLDGLIRKGIAPWTCWENKK